ncbi:hypothetical protein BH20ACI4_BH20ACI4_10740 [soil metagenome]
MVFYITIVFFLEIGNIITEETSHKLAILFRLPSYIYYNLLQLKSNDENLIESIVWVSTAILINIIMYASVIYLILIFVAGKVKKNNFSPEPPNPPLFEEENTRIN